MIDCTCGRADAFLDGIFELYDPFSPHSDPKECYCEEDQGAGYTYSDEHGDCDFCITQVILETKDKPCEHCKEHSVTTPSDEERIKAIKEKAK